MKAPRFSDAQTAFILKKGRGRRSRGRRRPQSQDQPSDLLQLEEEVRAHVAAGHAPVQAARRREREVALP